MHVRSMGRDDGTWQREYQDSMRVEPIAVAGRPAASLRVGLSVILLLHVSLGVSGRQPACRGKQTECPRIDDFKPHQDNVSLLVADLVDCPQSPERVVVLPPFVGQSVTALETADARSVRAWSVPRVQVIAWPLPRVLRPDSCAAGWVHRLSRADARRSGVR